MLLNRATNVCSGQNLLLFEGTPLGGYTSRTVASGYYPEIPLTHHSLWLSPDGALLIGSNAARSQLVTLPVSAVFGYDSSAVDRAPAAFAAANAAAAGLGYD
ncbi:MAG TPA: hypothetical protein VGK73_24995, partial [Polyangiaceae bacterium]